MSHLSYLRCPTRTRTLFTLHIFLANLWIYACQSLHPVGRSRFGIQWLLTEALPVIAVLRKGSGKVMRGEQRRRLPRSIMLQLVLFPRSHALRLRFRLTKYKRCLWPCSQGAVLGIWNTRKRLVPTHRGLFGSSSICRENNLDPQKGIDNYGDVRFLHSRTK